MDESREERQVETIESPLAKWPGALVLPDPDEFNGQQWQDWRKSVESNKAKGSINRLYAYSGADFLHKGHGTWDIETPSLDEFISWADHPMDERLRLVSWVGKQFQEYMGKIIDPKG